MAPFGGSRPWGLLLKRDISYPHGRASMSLSSVILEGWSQGVFVGGLLVLIMFTIANMRRRVLLHRLILLEVGRSRFLSSTIFGQSINCLFCRLARNCSWTWHVYLLPRSDIRLVSCSTPLFSHSGLIRRLGTLAVQQHCYTYPSSSITSSLGSR